MSDDPVSDPRDFLILDGEALRDFSFAWSIDRQLIYFRRNGATACLSPQDAEQMMKALMALLRGGFARAITETTLRLEQEESAWRKNRATSPSPTSSKPTLDLL